MPFVQLLFFDLSGGEIFIILVVAFLVFGPSKFPELARKIGKGINEIKRASSSIKEEINRETNHVKEDMNVDVDIDQDEVKDKKQKSTGKDTK